MTTIAEIKTALHQQVANTEDEKVLLKMQQYFKSLRTGKKKIIAYNFKGEPLSLREYKASVEESIKQYKAGKIRSQREIEDTI